MNNPRGRASAIDRFRDPRGETTAPVPRRGLGGIGKAPANLPQPIGMPGGPERTMPYPMPESTVADTFQGGPSTGGGFQGAMSGLKRLGAGVTASNQPGPNGFKKGGKVKAKAKASSASKRGDGIAQRGKTSGKFV